MEKPNYWTVDDCRPYFKNSNLKGVELEREVMKRFEYFQVKDDEIRAENNKWYQ
jgi:hypothetical protein